jgi:predicted nucleotidyltransferase
MGTLQDILALLRHERGRLFAKHALKSMAVFGSTARGEQRTDSDVDIMVEFDTSKDYDFLELAEELEGMLHRKVDLVTRKSVRPWYMEHIEPDLKYV